MTQLAPPPPATTHNTPESLLDDLNDEQRTAVRHPGGPLLILAGPGSGKTRAICHRIAWLVRAESVPADNILGITFTNKAANEMRARLAQLIGNRGPGPLLSTYHAFCARILRADGTHVGVPSTFVIYDTADQLKAARLAIDELDYDKDSTAQVCCSSDHAPSSLPTCTGKASGRCSTSTAKRPRATTPRAFSSRSGSARRPARRGPSRRYPRQAAGSWPR